jgi:hypothetical protein
MGHGNWDLSLVAEILIGDSEKYASYVWGLHYMWPTHTYKGNKKECTHQSPHGPWGRAAGEHTLLLILTVRRTEGFAQKRGSLIPSPLGLVFLI